MSDSKEHTVPKESSHVSKLSGKDITDQGDLTSRESDLGLKLFKSYL